MRDVEAADRHRLIGHMEDGPKAPEQGASSPENNTDDLISVQVHIGEFRLVRMQTRDVSTSGVLASFVEVAIIY